MIRCQAVKSVCCKVVLIYLLCYLDCVKCVTLQCSLPQSQSFYRLFQSNQPPALLFFTIPLAQKSYIQKQDFPWFTGYVGIWKQTGSTAHKLVPGPPKRHKYFHRLNQNVSAEKFFRAVLRMRPIENRE